MRLFRRRPQPTREEIRRAIPVRNDLVTLVGNTLSLPLAQKRGFYGWLARKSNAPNLLEIELDEIGLFVWALLDGKRNVAGIAKALSKQYKLNKHEAEASLLEFVDRLRQRGCIGLERK